MAGFCCLKLEHSVGASASNTSVAVIVLWLMDPAAINELVGALLSPNTMAHV